MKQSKLTKITALMLSMVMITSVFVGNTLSRYVTSVSSTDSARVAIWGINGGETTMELFKESYEVDGKTIAKSNVVGEKIIAPGTSGESKFSIINFESDTIPPEVAYEVKISLDDSEVDDKIKNNSSIEWKLDNGNWGTWDELKTSLLSLSGDPSGIYEYAPGQFANAFKGDVEHKIAWQWAMDNSNNVTDTTMGNDALLNDISAKISVSITAQQTDGSSVNMLDGANQVINLNDLQPAVFRSAAPKADLQEVKVNGTTVDPSNYEVEEGSTIIKLAVDYLRTLLKGTYKIEIVSKNMTATAKFYVSDGPIVHSGIIPVGGTYYVGVQPNSNGAYHYKNYTGATIYEAGDEFPKTINDGDVYVYGDYEYRYNMRSNGARWLDDEEPINGWSVVYIGDSQEPGKILSVINDKKLVDMTYTFAGIDITVSPEIPNTVVTMEGTFMECQLLVNAPVIPNSVRSLSGAFSYCSSLTTAPEIPDGVIDISDMFMYCDELLSVPNIPSSVINVSGAFAGCKLLTQAPVIPNNVTDISYVFSGCTSLTGTVEINANLTMATNHDCVSAFNNTVQPITLTGSSTKLSEIAATANNGNVTVQEETIPCNCDEYGCDVCPVS